MTVRSRKLRELCREISCQIQVPRICTGSPTVACHLNQQEFGKGMGHKADDAAVAAGCRACHEAVDNGASLSREDWRYYLMRGCIRTHVELWKQGRVAPV